MKTLYDLLGVDRHASFTDIEQSYRHSLNEHIAGNSKRPWRKKDQLRLQQMRQAYLTLSAPRKRLEYDLQLNEREHARLRKIERISTGAGLILLLAGLAIIGHSYYRQVYGDMPALQTVNHPTSAVTLPAAHMALVSRDDSSASPGKSGKD